MAVRKIAHPSVDDRKAKGLEARDRAPLSSHTKWRPAADRPDPVALLEEQDTTREPDLVPVRHGRMMVSPFTFYRGAAKIMAADLADTPMAGLDAQLCGDAHLSNFGVFASPERRAAVRPERLRRDAAGAVRVRREADGGELHDRGPQQRVLEGGHACGDAGVGAGLPGGDGRVRADARRWTSGTPTWTRTSSGPGSAPRWPGRRSRRRRPRRRRRRTSGRRRRRRPEKRAAKQEKAARDRGEGGQDGGEAGGEDHSRRRTPATACRRCPSSASWSMGSTGSSASRRSSSRRATWPPPTACPRTRSATALREQFRAYRATLQDDRRHLLERFEIVDMARKVVGVGSVGTRAFIVLLQGRDAQDPLFLQVKEATASVLEPYVGQEPVPAARRAGGAGAADDAGGQRHLPRLDQGAGRAPPLLLAAAARHEGLGAGRGDGTARAHVLRAHLRVDAGAGARPVRGPGRHRRVPGRRATRSTHRSPTSPSATPTRTSGTTTSS